jgi:hypothetical protein
MKLNNPYIFVNEYYTSQIYPKFKETKTILKEECGFRIKFCNGCGICFHRDIIAAENMVNKGLSHITNGLWIAAMILDLVVPKRSRVESLNLEGGKDQIARLSQEKLISCKEILIVNLRGSVNQIVYRSRTSKPQNPDLDLNQSESEDFQVMHLKQSRENVKY